MNNKVKTAMAMMIGPPALVAILWGSYWITKKLSYEWWYEDMVQETVREMVKPEYLKEVKNG